MSNHPFTTAILRWFQENRRDLPWRQTTDPYAIWLSEVILQQTRIQQGQDYWERFMQRFPTVEALAEATEDEVLRLWQGLGYYSRARNLHVAARQVVAAGRFPDTLEGIKALKGVGDYTAAAIGSIAFNLPAAVVDGNVYRVLARHFGVDTPINTTLGKKEFTALAQELLPNDQASAFNQAMMDFGAIQCTPQSPRCLLCPLSDTCEALRSGRVGVLPVKNRTMKIQTRRLTYIYIRYRGQTAIHRRTAGDIWQGLWEPCLVELSKESFAEWAAQYPGLLSDDNCHLVQKEVKHVLTHRILLADLYLWEPEQQPHLPSGYQWVAEASLDDYALPRLVEKLIATL
jgi:A/G-specific adenine glycosylase